VYHSVGVWGYMWFVCMCHIVSFFPPHKATLLMVNFFFKFLLCFVLVMLLCHGTKILLMQPSFVPFCCFIIFNNIFEEEVYLLIYYEITVLLNISQCSVTMCIVMCSTLCVCMFTLIISLWD